MNEPKSDPRHSARKRREMDSRSVSYTSCRSNNVGPRIASHTPWERTLKQLFNALYTIFWIIYWLVIEQKWKWKCKRTIKKCFKVQTYVLYFIYCRYKVCRIDNPAFYHCARRFYIPSRYIWGEIVQSLLNIWLMSDKHIIHIKSA
jgi:hypothetical protein